MKNKPLTIVAISNTNGQHRSLKLSNGDVIINAGDVSRSGRPEQLQNILDWFTNLKFRYKIFIACNHDFFFENALADIIDKMIPNGVVYLNDSSVEIKGIKILGSPITPWFNDWAFNRDRVSEIKKHWNLIPDDTDILVTHGPAFVILDETVCGKLTGCEKLLLRIYHFKPKYHIFGHIHEGYGNFAKGETTFINASVLDDLYEMRNEALEIKP